MLDYRIHTFLKLCDLMNYHDTATALNITQPAVSQHIRFLEAEYETKLFNYTNRKLSKTLFADALENHVKSALYNELHFRKTIAIPEKHTLNIGATKTIGDYILPYKISHIMKESQIQISLVIENTQSLLAKLHNLEIDIALIEGFYNKSLYECKLLKKEKFIGICHQNHPFANQSIPLDAIFHESVLLRETGSGTRAAFERRLSEHNYTIESFAEKSFISSFEIIKKCTLESGCISFVYESIANSDPNLATFNVPELDLYHEFNYVCLKNSSAQKYIALLESY